MSHTFAINQPLFWAKRAKRALNEFYNFGPVFFFQKSPQINFASLAWPSAKLFSFDVSFLLIPKLFYFFSEKESNGSSRRSSVYPTTSRRCSEAVAEFAATGDLEAVAEILKAGKDSPEDDDEGFAMPPEKERRRLVLVVSCVGLTMTFMAAIMVGITLGLSHMMENSQFRKCT